MTLNLFSFQLNATTDFTYLQRSCAARDNVFAKFSLNNPGFFPRCFSLPRLVVQRYRA